MTLFEELRGRIYKISNGKLDYMLVRAKTRQGARAAAAKHLIEVEIPKPDDLIEAGRRGVKVLDAETGQFDGEDNKQASA